MEAVAYHNWGRWVADCAHPDCPNAEELDPRNVVMVCSYCSLLSQVRWPAEVGRIETVLALRPVPSTRNWLPGETVDDLANENVAHGVEGY